MSTRSLSSIKLSLKMSASVVNALDDATPASATQPSLSYTPSISDGVDESQANRGWHSKSRTIENGHQEILDLLSFWDIGAGAGNDCVGIPMTLAEVVAIAIVNDNLVGAAGSLEILPSPSEGWTPIGTHTVATGGALLGQGMIMKCQMAAVGFAISDVPGSTSHRITMRASGGDVTYSIYLLGRHDVEASSSSSISFSSPSSLSSSSPSSISTSSSSISTSSISTSGSSSSISTSSSSVSSSSISSISTSSSSVSSSSESSSSMSS